MPSARKCQTLPQLQELREACLPTFRGTAEVTEGEKIAYNLKNKVLEKMFDLLSVTWLR